MIGSRHRWTWFNPKSEMRNPKSGIMGLMAGKTSGYLRFIGIRCLRHKVSAAMTSAIRVRFRGSGICGTVLGSAGDRL